MPSTSSSTVLHSSSSREIAIIGAGMAGLTAAIRLQAAGYRVVIFEKSRGPGGRLASRRIQDESGSVDIGAQYFTIRNDAFRAFLDQYAGPEAYNKWHGKLRHQRDDLSWEAFADGHRYVGVPRMTAISRALAAHIDMRSGVRIAQLNHQSDHRIVLTDTDGATHGPFKNVVITAPPAQAQSLLKTSEDQTVSENAVFAGRALAACWALAIRFHQSLNLDHDGFACKHSVLQWIANNSSKPGRTSGRWNGGEWWVLHAQADWSEAHQDADGDWISAKMLAAFNDITETTSKPDDQMIHRWLYAKTQANSPGPLYRWFPEQRIGLCGDWLTGGRVEGAFESAEALVCELVKQGKPAKAAGKSE